MMQKNFEAVIGLEIHAQLSTTTKIFCGCLNKFGSEPNTNICPVCLGLPGSLPVLNRKAVEFAIMMGLATNCQINRYSVFARKNYFYPDLPKGYQISQYELPICSSGYLSLSKENKLKNIRINRIHLEEDAGKSIHGQFGETMIDVNRCGTPLIEIVTEPDIRSAAEAALFMTKIRQILRYLRICDGNMEEGSLRCDANISVRPVGGKTLGVKTEVKNMNSIRNIERAINFEIERQIDTVSSGGEIIQQTLLWDAEREIAETMRTKEESHDYRYFPDPDLAPVTVSEKEINELKEKLPELPDQKYLRFMKDYNLPDYDSEILTQQKEIADYFESAVKSCNNYKIVSNWIMTEVMKNLNENKIDISDFPVLPENLGLLIKFIDNQTISSKIAKKVFNEMVLTGKSPEKIISEKNLIQISDTSELEKIIDEVISSNLKQVEEYKAGKEKILGFFVGEVMKRTKGKANPGMVNSILINKLKQ